MENMLLTRQKNNNSISEVHFTSDLEIWKSKLDGEIPVLNLPIDFPRSYTSVFNPGSYTFTIPTSIYQGIKMLSQNENVAPFEVIMTIFMILMYRYGNEEDIIVGANVKAENTLVLRTQLNEEWSFLETLLLVKEVFQEAINHKNIPFDELVSKIPHHNNNNRSPFFQVMVNMKYMEEITNGEKNGIESTNQIVDLNLNVTEVDDELKCSLVYDKDLFEDETIIRMSGHFHCLLKGAIDNPSTNISLLPILSSSERHKILYQWNSTQVEYPHDSTINELFEEQVRLNPDSVAIIFEDEKVTYRELNVKANKIANYLIELNIEAEQLVAICLDRSPNMIASFLGVLKTGGAYVPIDLSYPKERIAYMLEDSNASFVITTEAILTQLPTINSRKICLDKEIKAIEGQSDECTHRSNADSLAYVMYTSGSTGKPKGVEIIHRGIVRLVKNNSSYANLGPEEIILNRASVAFDVSVFEIYGSLLNGGKLVIMKSHKPSFEEFALTIHKNQVTILRVPPDLLNMFLEDYSDYLGSLRQVFCGGEVLPVWLARKFLSKLKNCKLINSYGPTENTVNTTCCSVKEIAPNATSIPIGRPISNDCVYILDKHFQPVPIGVVGELYISGEGIARGYLNKYELTNERFPYNPFSEKPGRKLYKSGDLVRYLSDGNIEFIGRTDDQVKIRGVRIELGEVEATIGMLPDVRQVVVNVIKGKSGSNELVAYVVPIKGVRFEPNKLRNQARTKLPDHMIPTFFVELQEIPVTPVGKIDRKRLPDPTLTTTKKEISSPRNEVEIKMVKLWESLLNTQPIGIRDNFFELGGNSLLAMRMFSDIEKTFNKRLPVSIIFQEETIENLARIITSKDQLADLSSSLVPIQPHGSQPPIFCIHGGGGGEVLMYGELAGAFGNEQPVFGLRYTDSGDPSQVTVSYMAEKYIKEIKSVQPVGPYSLLGFCYGGAIAYEMATKLLNGGEEVSLLTILNFSNPAQQSVEIYKKRIFDNLKLLFKQPLKQQLSFFVQKSKNAFKLYKSMSDTSEVRYIIWKAISEYKPNPYPGKIILIRANKSNDSENYLGWETTADGSITLYNVPAEHATLIKKPNSEIVVNYLKKHMDNK